VSAQVLTDASDPRFKEVEDRIAFGLRSPSSVLAACQSYYSAHESRRCWCWAGGAGSTLTRPSPIAA